MPLLYSSVLRLGRPFPLNDNNNDDDDEDDNSTIIIIMGHSSWAIIKTKHLKIRRVQKQNKDKERKQDIVIIIMTEQRVILSKGKM